MKRMFANSLVVLVMFVCAVSAFAQGKWNFSETTSGMDGVKISVATLPANSSEETLIVRCTGKKLEIYIHAGNVVDEEYGEHVKFDDGRPQHQMWGRSSSYDSLFAPGAGKLLHELQSSHTFMFEYHPYQKVATTATFDVVGLPITGCN